MKMKMKKKRKEKKIIKGKKNKNSRYRGHGEIARLLVTNGANVNAQGGDFGNALQAALSGAGAEIVDTGSQSGQSIKEDKVWKKIWSMLHRSKVIQKFSHLKS